LQEHLLELQEVLDLQLQQGLQGLVGWGLRQGMVGWGLPGRGGSQARGDDAVVPFPRLLGCACLAGGTFWGAGFLGEVVGRLEDGGLGGGGEASTDDGGGLEAPGCKGGGGMEEGGFGGGLEAVPGLGLTFLGMKGFDLLGV